MSGHKKLLTRIENKEAKATIVGLGYIGLPTALIYKRSGLAITGIDTNEELVAELRDGKIRMKENGIEKLAEKHLSDITLDASYDSITDSDVFVLCLPSPIDENGKPVTRYLENSVTDIGSRVTGDCLVIVESTVPVGTTERLSSLFAESNGKTPDKDFWFAHCPERVFPGQIVLEMDTNHRLAGGVSELSTSLAVAFLKTVFNPELIHPTGARVSETAKLAENAFRDVGIAYANELAKVCTSLSIDVREVIELANLHPRVDILNPSLGVGGYCLPKDGWILVESVRQFDGDGVLIPAARQVNDSMPAHVSKRIRDMVLDLSLRSTVGILGVSFKPNVSDTRNSPSLELIKLLWSTGMEVIVYDPLVEQKVGDRKVDSIEEILQSCDIMVLGAAHDVLLKELHEMDLSEMVFVDPPGVAQNLEKQVRRYVGLSI
ncbi:MAG: nucleotide sugar dehydrogenase [Candidatus Thorarchaeota archaeon]